MQITDVMQKHPELRELFSEFSVDMLSLLQLKTYEPQEFIIKKGTHDKNLFIVVDGVCGSDNSFDAGQRTLLYKLSAFDAFGLTELFSDNHARETNLIAYTKVHVIAIPNTVVKACFGVHQQFIVYVVMNILRRLHRSIAMSKECVNYESDLTLLTYLLQAYHFYRKNYPPTYTGLVKIEDNRQDMADLTAMSVRTINRVLKCFRDNGLIQIQRGKVSIDHRMSLLLADLKLEKSSQ